MPYTTFDYNSNVSWIILNAVRSFSTSSLNEGFPDLLADDPDNLVTFPNEFSFATT